VQITRGLARTPRAGSGFQTALAHTAHKRYYGVLGNRILRVVTCGMQPGILRSTCQKSTASNCRGYRFGVLDHLVANAIFFLYGQCTFQSNGYDDLVSTPGQETKDRPRPGCRGLLRDAGSWFTSVVVVSFHVASAHIFHGLSSEPC
jgi:hypothetical protein